MVAVEEMHQILSHIRQAWRLEYVVMGAKPSDFRHEKRLACGQLAGTTPYALTRLQYARSKSAIEPPHSVRTDRHLPISPKANAFADEHTNLLVLQRPHPASPERPVPILPADLFHLLRVLRRIGAAMFLRRRRPLALEPADEKAGRDNAVARDARRKRVVTQRAAHGARRARSESRADVLVRRYFARGDRSDQVVYRPMVRRDSFSGLGAERVALGAGQGVVDVTF